MEGISGSGAVGCPCAGIDPADGEAHHYAGTASWRRSERNLRRIDGLTMSLDKPDKSLDAVWAAEAENPLKANRADTREGIALEEIFKEE